MFRWDRVILIIGVFVVGWLACAGYDYYSEQNKEQPMPVDSVSGEEISSPGDWIDLKQIKGYDDKIVINISNATIAQFTDTNSMDPFIDENANSIEIIPIKDDLKIGDIISYEFEGKKIIHRIVNISEDEEGVYYVLKGDNNLRPDKEKVRFEQISGVVVGVIY